MTDSIYGTWQVTTEGDCEGRTTKNLGVYVGYVDEIAFALSEHCCYTLDFHAITPKELPTPITSAKRIVIRIASLGTDANVYPQAHSLFMDRDVQVRDGGGYCRIELTRTISAEEESRLARESALAKLSPADRLALGV